MTNFTVASPQSVFTEDGAYLTQLPDGYYATKTYTDKLIEFINNDRGDGKPFCAYVAHQAPHDPYHLPREWRGRHVGTYDQGWLARLPLCGDTVVSDPSERLGRSRLVRWLWPNVGAGFDDTL